MPAIQGYPLPTVINPPNSLSVCVPVPDDPGHRQAFLGALMSLTYWYNWHPNAAKTGKDAAAVWKPIFNDVALQLAARNETCQLFGVRQNETDPCELDFTNDGGETWEQFADLQLCPPSLILVGGVPVIVMPDGSFILPTSSDTFDGRTLPYTPPVRPEPPDDAICLAATNATNVIYALHSEVFSSTFVPTATWVGLTLGSVIVGLLALPVAAAVLVGVILAGGGVAILSGVDLVNFTPGVRKRLRCILQDNATNTAGVVTFDYDAVKADVEARIVGINIWAAIDLYLNVIGESGLNRAGATTAITEAVCDDCDNWCYRWNDANQLAGWTALGWAGQEVSLPSYSAAAWHNGEVHAGVNGAGHNVTYIHIQWDFASTVQMTDFSVLGYTGTSGISAWINGDGSLFSGTQVWNSGGYFGGSGTDVDNIAIIMDIVDALDPLTITSIQMSGEGENPIGEDNC